MGHKGTLLSIIFIFSASKAAVEFVETSSLAASVAGISTYQVIGIESSSLTIGSNEIARILIANKEIFIACDEIQKTAFQFLTGKTFARLDSQKQGSLSDVLYITMTGDLILENCSGALECVEQRTWPTLKRLAKLNKLVEVNCVGTENGRSEEEINGDDPKTED